MTITELIQQAQNTPEAVEFSQVIEVINENYAYTPTDFKNGAIENEQGTNEGSCKIFYFAKLNKLNQAQTLALFGHYYREDVLGNPTGDDHGNIRNFIKYGWQGIDFKGEALKSNL